MQVLVTGSTGHVGSHLALELARKGIDVLCLARSKASESATQRVQRAVCLAGDLPLLPHEIASRLSVFEHDLERDSPEVLRGLVRSRGVESIWHAAAATNLCRDVAWTPDHENLRTTKNLLGAADSAARFYFVSTAYQCGRLEGPAREERLSMRPASFRNAYEHSKWACEQLLWDALSSRLTVFRPSIVLGRTDAQRVDCWQGYYSFVRKAHRLLLATGKSVCDGAEIGILGREEQELDLVFADGLVSAMVSIGLAPRSRERTFHLTAPERITLGSIADDLAAVTGLRLVLRSGERAAALRPSPILAALQPYLLEGPRFDRRETESMQELLGFDEPHLTTTLSRRHISLAVSTPAGAVRLAS